MFRKCGIYDEWFLGVPLAFNNYNESNQEFQAFGNQLSEQVQCKSLGATLGQSASVTNARNRI